MKLLTALACSTILSLAAVAASDAKEEPVRHLEVADVTSIAQAKDVFIDTTAQLKRMKQLNAQEAAQIHVITYSLEKSVAYFADNLTGDKQGLAKQMAVVVEDIHIASENARLDALKAHMAKYSMLVDKFLFGF
jgi:transposase-like protein